MPSCVSRPGFTLTEVLIVIGIILLLILLALPAFSIFRGERSTEAAENQLSAMLARARTEAIGYQRVGGVMFFRDPREPDRVSVAAVQEAEHPGGPREVYLELIPDREFVVLPAGVGIQVVDDCDVDPGATPVSTDDQRKDDGYLNLNKEVHINTQTREALETGGVILFDANGRLMSVEYGFRIAKSNPARDNPTAMGDLIFFNPDGAIPNPHLSFPTNSLWVDPASHQVETNNIVPRSQFGLIAYDDVAYKNAFTDATTRDPDPQWRGLVGTNYTQTEKAEEDWLDKNAIPLLVNRYNGTVTRGLK